MAAIDPRARIVETLLDQRRKSVRWLAKQVGKSHQTVQNWLDGTNAPRDGEVWDQLIAALRPSSKPEGISPASDTITLYRTPMRMVPIGGVGYAGKPHPAYQDVEWEEMKDWGGMFDRWGKVVAGSSMEDLLYPGDRVIFENRAPESGHVVHAIKEGDEFIKVLRRNGDHSGVLVSVNRDYADVDAAGFEILGVAVARIRYLEEGIRDLREYPHGIRHRF